ncbi:MAG: VOC family protein [Oscillospiraceae bacterium]|nr:VOC family protein [Candidatus Equicaccousia limihippi]
MQTKAFYTAITTDDMDATIDFYVGLLGFHIAHRLKTPTGVVMVLENDMGAKLDVYETDERKPGLHALRTNVADLDAAVEEIKAQGYSVFAGPMDVSTGKSILIEDPNGIIIDITQHIRKNK